MLNSGSKDPIVLTDVGSVSTKGTLSSPPPLPGPALTKGGGILLFPRCWRLGWQCQEQANYVADQLLPPYILPAVSVCFAKQKNMA